jgi:hypothetical protein
MAIKIIQRDCQMKEGRIKFSLPEHLVDKAASFPESSYDATILTLVLADGTRVPHVHVAGRDVIKATGTEEESVLSTLNPKNIANVLPEFSPLIDAHSS